MSRYVDPTEQLVTEIVVRDIRRSTEFYCRLGFRPLSRWPRFCGTYLGRSQALSCGVVGFSPGRSYGVTHTFIVSARERPMMVPDVDDHWRLANEIGARIIVPLADRYYGLRDFTVADPDGFGIRFASVLEAR